jgi:flagellar basal-body rod protein FlgF
MDGPSIIALSGQVALQHQLDTVANNVANMNAAGFRGDRMLFQSFISRLAVPGRQVAFVQDRATYVDATQGPIESTGNPLDIAINGEGFLAVQRPGDAGRGYTRDGRLKVSPSRTLVDNAGRPVLDDGGTPILIPERTSRLEIRAEGTIIATIDRRPQQVGRIGLSRAGDPRAVRKAGDGLFDIPTADLRPVDPLARSTRIVQGSLETSNVRPVQEIANLTDLQRSYERMQKIMTDDDGRLHKMIDALGRPN